MMRNWHNLLPFILIFLIAVVASTVQVFFLQQSNCALLYDSEGYFKTAASCLKLINNELVSQISSYIASGFSEEKRLAILYSLGPVSDLVKDGPVIIFVLALPYLFLGKAMIPVNWQLGIITMIICQASIAPLLFLTAKNLWDKRTAFITAAIALTYPAFVINSGRMLSEIPAVFFFALLISILSWLISSQGKLPFILKMLIALLMGFCITALMLARPSLIVIPLLLAFSLLVARYFLGKFTLPKKYWPMIFSVLLGLLLSLIPWILCKQILTGHPSILVERHGLYNLWAGLNLKYDGWDILPSTYVNNPEKFELTSEEVLQDIQQSCLKEPLLFSSLVLRKALRLLDCPWNDFEAAFLGLPWLFQRWWHQVIILLGIIGSVIALKDAWRRRNYLSLSIVIFLVATIAYHFSNIVFISMSRYFFTAMPAVILLAGYALTKTMADFNKFKETILITLILPIINMGFAINNNFFWLNIFTAAIMAYWFVTAGRDLNLHKRIWAATSWAILGMASVAAVALAGQNELNTNGIAEPCLKVQLLAKLPELVNSGKYLIVINNSSDNKTVMNNLKIIVNGKLVPGPFLPLWAFDNSQRSNFMAAKALAYSRGQDVDDLHQWWCIGVPTEFLNENINSIVLLSEKEPYHLFSDSINQKDNQYHSFDINQFSWTKGYFADYPGEMRQDKYLSLNNDIVNDKNTVMPRVSLLLLSKSTENKVSKLESKKLDLEPVVIGSNYKNRIKEYSFSDLNLKPEDNLNAFKIKVSGKYHLLKKNSLASVCLIETIAGADGQNRLEYAPLAPNVLNRNDASASNGWNDFVFEDICPLNANDSLKNLRVICATRAWWEVLAYGSYKGNGPVEFKNLLLEVSPISTVNLIKQKWQLFPCSLVGRSR